MFSCPPSSGSSSFSDVPPSEASGPSAVEPVREDLVVALIAAMEHDDEQVAAMWNDLLRCGVTEFAAVVVAEPSECLICRQTLTIGVEIPCGHDFFHPNCLSVYWDIEPSCPICRAAIPAREIAADVFPPGEE